MEKKYDVNELSEELKGKSQDELSEDELEKIAGGWSWENFISGFTGGAVVGGAFAGGVAFLCASNPIGWAVGGALVVGGVLGGGIGAAG